MNTVFIMIICVLLAIGAFVGSCIAGQTFSNMSSTDNQRQSRDLSEGNVHYIVMPEAGTSGGYGRPSASGQDTDICSSCPYRKSQVIRIEVDPTPNKTEKHEQKDAYD